MLPAVERYAPDLVVIACGVDAHRRDPLAEPRARGPRRSARSPTDVRDLCARLGIGEPALVLEGGYDLVALGGAAAEIAARLLGDAAHVGVAVARSPRASACAAWASDFVS